MEDKRIVDYFTVCGVPESSAGRKFYLPDKQIEPITGICVINRTDNEPVPPGYTMIDKTVDGHDANLNHGSYYSSDMYLCVRRGAGEAPLKSVGVFYENTDTEDKSIIIKKTPSGFDANVNNHRSKTFVTYQKWETDKPQNQLVVTNICVILSDKHELPPQAHMKINKNLNKGFFGSEVYLCFKLAYYEPKYLRYDPVLLDRFPLEDELSRLPIPDFFPHFCLPRGAAIQCWPKTTVSLGKPKSLNFVLTSEQAHKLYVATIWFYDEIDPKDLNDEELAFFGFNSDKRTEIDKKFFRTKSISFISRWPFFDQFKDFGVFLVNTFGVPTLLENASEDDKKKKGSLESYIYKFMEHVPFPRSDKPIRLLYAMENGQSKEIAFTQTFDDLPFFSSGASFEKLLMNLGSENCLYILLFALTEQKILLHTLRPGILAEITEAITTMIFPFNWQCPYIPLCPMNLYSFVHAPLPFIIGIGSQYFDDCGVGPPDDVISIDLDTKSIYASEKKAGLTLSILPKKEVKTLKAKLDDLIRRYNENKINNEAYYMTKRRLDIECQEAFLYFMASLLKDFKSCLKPITAVPKVGATDPTTLFDMDRFLKSKETASQLFYNSFLRTQMFTKFIEERCLVSDKNISLAFFDECVDKVEKFEKGSLKIGGSASLIEIDEQLKDDSSNLIIDLNSIHLNVDVNKIPLNKTGIGALDHKQFFMFHDKGLLDLRQSFNSLGTSSSSSGNRDSFDSSAIVNDLQIYPVVKRTKYEIKKSSRIAEKVWPCPVERAKHLLQTAYGVWFTHFPAYSHYLRESNVDSLDLAFQVLKRIHSMRFSTSEEFCYRILMVLCCVYNRPALAVKVLLHTKKIGLTMNAITYGYYNKAVLESNWSSENSGDSKIENRRKRSGTERWKLLRNVLSVVNFMSRRMAKQVESEPEVEVEVQNAVQDHLEEQNNVENQENIPQESDHLNDFSIRTLKDEQIEAHIVISDGESLKAETNSIKSEDSFNDTLSTRFTTPIKEAWTNMDIFSNKSKVGSTLRSSFRFAKTKFGNKKDSDLSNNLSFSTPTKIPKSQTFEDNLPAITTTGSDNHVAASAGNTPSGDRSFVTTGSANQWSGSEYVFSTYKQAANRIKELKQQYTSNSAASPIKNQFLASNILAQFKMLTNDSNDQNLDQISDCGVNLTKPEDVLSNLRHYRDLFDTANMFYLGPILEPPEVEPKIALVIEMISACVCNKCDSIVYDEEIISGWGALDSDMKSKCSNKECSGSSFVPNLTIFLKDYRQPDGEISDQPTRVLDSISVNYLSPMALRKELETILHLEGYSCLLSPKFVEDHGPIYWNLLWYFQRINLPSHISGLALMSKGLKPEVEPKEKLGCLNVKVVCQWDWENLYSQETSVPKHRKWLEMKSSGESDADFEEDVKQLLEKVGDQDFGPALRYLISKRVVSSESKSIKFPSLYRDLFFLAVAKELDMPLDVFDKLYCDAFAELTDKERQALQQNDQPPNVFTIFCRSLFKQLTLG